MAIKSPWETNELHSADGIQQNGFAKGNNNHKVTLQYQYLLPA